MAVIWNPSVRKSVGIVIPLAKAADIFVGFVVCPDTSHPKLVKISVDVPPSMCEVDLTPSVWEVEVFTLSTRVWKTVYMGAPFKSCHFTSGQVFVDGIIYFCAYYFDRGSRINSVISFDLKSEKFGEVCLPEKLLHARYLDVMKVNESLGLLEYYIDGKMSFCGVWSRKDGANKPFTKIYSYNVKAECRGLLSRVLGFRNNGEAVIEVMIIGDKYKQSRIEVYDPFSGHINGVGIDGNQHTFRAGSYMETLLLLDESDSIIY